MRSDERPEREIHIYVASGRGTPVSRRDIQLLRTVMIGSATFAAAFSAANRAKLWKALRNRPQATPPLQRTKRALWRRLPPHRYPGYYPLPYMIIEKVVADRTVLALNRFVKGHLQGAGRVS
jgi:hypothetical protein